MSETNGQKDPEEETAKNKGGAYTVEDKVAAWELYIELLSIYVDRPKMESECVPPAVMETLDNLFKVRTDVFRRAGSKSIKTLRKFMPFLDENIRPFVQKWHNQSGEGAFNGEYMLSVKRPIFYEEIQEIYGTIQGMCETLARIAGVPNFAED